VAHPRIGDAALVSDGQPPQRPTNLIDIDGLATGQRIVLRRPCYDDDTRWHIQRRESMVALRTPGYGPRPAVLRLCVFPPAYPKAFRDVSPSYWL
jgi:hypothetical protein